MNFYLVAAIALFALALLAIASALFPRRVRGLPHCPHCRFNMSGINGLKCPECGKTAKNEQALFKRRWRRGRIILGLLLIPLGFAVMEVPKVLKVGLPNYTPGWALRAGMPSLYKLDYAWTKAFLSNYAEHTDEQGWRRVLEHCLDVLQDPSAHVQEKRWAMNLIYASEGGVSGIPPSYRKAKLKDLDQDRVLLGIAAALSCEDARVQRNACSLLGSARSDAALRVAVPWMIAHLSDFAKIQALGYSVPEFTLELRTLTRDRPPAVDGMLREDMDSPLPASVEALAQLSKPVTDAERLRVVTPLFADPDPRVRVVVYWYAGFIETTPHAQLYRDALGDSAPKVQALAPWLATRVTGSPDHIISIARELLSSTDPFTRWAGIQLLEKHGRKVSAAAPLLLEQIRAEGYTPTRRFAALALARIADDDAPVIAAIESILTTPSPRPGADMRDIRVMIEAHPGASPKLVPFVLAQLEAIRTQGGGNNDPAHPAYPLVDFLARYARNDPAALAFIQRAAQENSGSALQAAASEALASLRPAGSDPQTPSDVTNSASDPHPPAGSPR